MTEILELKALHSLAKLSSWAKAAEELGVSPAELGQIVTRLEQRLGVQLLDRTTAEDPVHLTEAGVAFHARTRKALDDLAKVEATLLQTPAHPSGRIRITAPVLLGQLHVAPLIGKLRRTYPELAVELSLMDRFVDLVHENVDLAIRAGSPFDARLMTRRLCANRRILVASPAYLEEHGAPEKPEDLVEHECLLFTSFANPREWKLRGPEGSVTVNVNGMVSSNAAYVVNLLAEHGEGITVGATLALAPALLDGRLVRVLPAYELEPSGIFAAYPSTARLPTRVSAVIDFFASELSDPPLWDRELAGKVPGF